MANTHNPSVRIRMYRQGLGDCFLLTFTETGKEKFNMLIDCGLLQNTENEERIMQTVVAEGKRGRVMSFYTLAVIGMQPFGSLVSGMLADRIGAPMTVVIGGAIIMVCSLWFGRKLHEIRTIVRPIYRDLGILPEVDLAVIRN